VRKVHLEEMGATAIVELRFPKMMIPTWKQQAVKNRSGQIYNKLPAIYAASALELRRNYKTILVIHTIRKKLA
jgi:hypothetical protein